VLAHVERIEKRSKPEFALLRVLETWKGPVSDTVRVDLSIGHASLEYHEGREVLAFLERQRIYPFDGVWRTVGGSYGIMNAEGKELQDFYSLIEKIELEPLPLGTEFEKDWHVEAASRRSSRGHGLYGLVLRGKDIRRFVPPRDDLLDLLSTEDKEKIAYGFLEDPSSDETFPWTLEVLQGFESAEIDRKAVALVEGLLLDCRPPSTAPAIGMTLKRFAESDSLNRLWYPKKVEEVFELLSKGHYDGRLVEFWGMAKRELGIPSVEPLVLTDGCEARLTSR
jgi:hypothetical protein